MNEYKLWESIFAASIKLHFDVTDLTVTIETIYKLTTDNVNVR